jgi:hypothetical protein
MLIGLSNLPPAEQQPPWTGSRSGRHPARRGVRRAIKTSSIPTRVMTQDSRDDAGRLDRAAHEINLQAGMASPVPDALTDRGVPFVFTTGDNEAKIPPRWAQVMQCEEPINPIEIARALFDRGRQLSRFHKRRSRAGRGTSVLSAGWTCSDSSGSWTGTLARGQPEDNQRCEMGTPADPMPRCRSEPDGVWTMQAGTGGPQAP